MDHYMKKLVFTLAALLTASVGIGQTKFPWYEPAVGIQFNATGNTYINTAATAAQVAATYTGQSGCSGGAALLFSGVCAAIVSAPAGSNTQIQYNNSGAFGGASNITFSNSTGDLTIAAPISGNALAVTGIASQNAVQITAPNSSGVSFGLLVTAGTNASDRSFLAQSAAGTNYLNVLGDGGVEVGAPTGGDKGLGSVNMQSCFVNNAACVVGTVTVPLGGTGVSTLTTHGVLLGEGTSNVSAVAAMAADTLLQGQGTSSDPIAVSVNNCGSSTQALSYSTSTHTFGCQTISVGTGTVTSVGFSDNSTTPIYTIGSTPVTNSGTITQTLVTQSANTVFAGPSTGSAAQPAFRALVSADLPTINLGSTSAGGVLSTSILAGANGGTGNGFFAVSGPATSLRTFTFPNVSATVLTTNADVTVAQGGTGVGTLTAHGVLLGEGTSNVSAVAAMAADTLLQGQGTSADPAAVSVNNCGSSTQALSYSTSTHAFGCQTISTSGTPGGSNTQIQYNNSGAFGGASNITYSSSTGGLTIAAPTSGISLLATGIANQRVAQFQGASGTGTSDGVLITAGTNASDVALEIANTSFGTDFLRVIGDGGVEVGSPTGGDKGLGTVNATALYVNGVSVPASIIAASSGGVSASGINAGQTLVAYKANTTSRNSTTTTSNDPDLIVTNMPAGTYKFRLYVTITQPNTTMGMSWNMNFSGTNGGSFYSGYFDVGGGSPSLSAVVQNGLAASPTASTQSITGTNLTVNGGALTVEGVLVVSASGTLGFSWAQQTSNASNLSISASYLEVLRIL
jgi:hypothetical protein